MSLHKTLRARDFVFDASQWDKPAYVKALLRPMLNGVVSALHIGRKPGGNYTFRTPITPAEWIDLGHDVEIWAKQIKQVLRDLKAGRAAKACVRAAFDRGLELVARLEYA
jgi:hypothetical protein